MTCISQAAGPPGPYGRNWALRRLRLAILITAGMWAGDAWTAAPRLLHLSGYQSPVHGGPDDLLYLSGDGFSLTDRIVYAATEGQTGVAHPAAVPTRSTARAGIASIVQVAGNPARSLTIRLPEQSVSGAMYRLWVVNRAGEWSRPIFINDPRPQWLTPAFAYVSADPAGLKRKLRLVGRNLTSRADSGWLRLQGPRSYTLPVSSTPAGSSTESDYVAEVSLPERMAPGTYTVSFKRDDLSWVHLLTQTVEVLPDPATLPRFQLDDANFGTCRPDDANDDSVCLARAIDAASHAGGGVVIVPPGRWNLSTVRLPNGRLSASFVLPRNVHLRGAGARASHLLWHHDASASELLTLSGNNSITDIAFSDDQHLTGAADSKPILRLGTSSTKDAATDPIADVLIADNTFVGVGEAIVDSGRPLQRLSVLRNDFGAYANAIYLAHAPYIDDSIFRWNRFLPGSYTDIAAHQGTIATQLGASRRVDFSSNFADGASSAALQDGGDPPGFRAAFFWNLTNNAEQVLVADNRITCPGDKVGDGEAIAFDGNENTTGFASAPPVLGAGSDWVRVKGALLTQQRGHAVAGDYYVGHWLTVVEGRGLGQSRRVVSYEVHSGTVILHVSPAWDVIPTAPNRIVVERQYWQVYVVANDVEQRAPPCRKANLSGPHGGLIGIWAPSADSVIAGNRQTDTDGIEFLQSYSAAVASCASCDSSASLQTGLEIRENRIAGEYDWTSDCSKSGIMGALSASPTPESPPPLLSYGVAIDHNTIEHADGFRGGAIDVALTWYGGPQPEDWPLVTGMLIYHNSIRDISGPAPNGPCRYGQRARIGIRLDGKGNVRNTVLYGNRCEHVSAPLDDHGKDTLRICTDRRASCECDAR